MTSLFDGWRKYLLLSAALFLASGLGAGCSDDDDNGTGPGNGGGVDGHISFTFDGTQYTAELCMAHYMIADGETSITSGDGSSWTLTFEFPGSGTGSFNVAGGVHASMTFPPMYWYEPEEFTVTVTAYGAIGGAVTGTFSGTMVNSLDENDVKQITNGTFTAQRLPNVD